MAFMHMYVEVREHAIIIKNVFITKETTCQMPNKF